MYRVSYAKSMKTEYYRFYITYFMNYIAADFNEWMDTAI
jgi:hypothetical protein